MGRGEGKYAAVLRFWASQEITERIDQLIALKGHGTRSEFLRDAVHTFVKKKEEEYGLPSVIPTMVGRGPKLRPIPPVKPQKVSHAVKMAGKKKRQSTKKKSEVA